MRMRISHSKMDDDDDDFDEASLLQWKRHIQRGVKKARVSNSQSRESKKTSHLKIMVAKNNAQQADPVDEASSRHCATDVLPIMETDPSVIALNTSATVVIDTHTDYKSQPPTGSSDAKCMLHSSLSPSISPSSRKSRFNKRRKNFIINPSKTCPYKRQTSLLKFAKVINSDTLETRHLKTSIISSNQEKLPLKYIRQSIPSENVSKGVAGNGAIQPITSMIACSHSLTQIGSPAESSLLPATDVGSSAKVCGRKKKEWWAKTRGHRECPFYKRVPGVVAQ